MSDSTTPLPISASEDELLVAAAQGDERLLERLRSRVRSGEPAPYVAGFIEFRGRRFHIDPRAYITDPEVTHLIDVVGEEGDALEREFGRSLRVLEFGTGAATLAVSLKLEHPRWTVAGLDVDRDALALASENVSAHSAMVELIESDFFSSWPADRPQPDLIFGDPPWGSAEDLYNPSRDAEYYRQMPPRSAFPSGGRTGMHDAVVRHIQERGWTSLLVFNYGVLPRGLVEASASRLKRWQIRSPGPQVSIVVGRAC
ncbi:hypothetical protein DB347_21730 [Opitutaceae bacterium EW11]|nr:hypothetical protein DB347_21730 [Opitutaceae bacterium EW11]